MNIDNVFDYFIEGTPQTARLVCSTSSALSHFHSGLPAVIGIKDDHLYAKLYCGDKVIKYKSTKIKEVSYAQFDFINVETRSGSTSTWMLLN